MARGFSSFSAIFDLGRGFAMDKICLGQERGSLMFRAYRWMICCSMVIFTTFLFAPRAARAQDASLLYKVYCARCHGFTGHGDGADAGTLKTAPRNFTDCKLMHTISDDTMFNAIKDGGAAVNLPNDMPSWSAGLSDDQIHALMKYIRGFCQK
jgi:cytochrome c oxidase cbb3-type subunit III